MPDAVDAILVRAQFFKTDPFNSYAQPESEYECHDTESYKPRKDQEERSEKYRYVVYPPCQEIVSQPTFRMGRISADDFVRFNFQWKGMSAQWLEIELGMKFHPSSEFSRVCNSSLSGVL